MAQPKSPRIFTITQWTPPPGDQYSDLVKLRSPLIIFPILDDSSLLWIDGPGNLCLIRSLKTTDPILRVGPGGAADMPFQDVSCTETGDQLTVYLTFNDGQAGPVGTIIAEVNPPIDLPVPARLWRWLRSLFLRLFSLFR